MVNTKEMVMANAGGRLSLSLFLDQEAPGRDRTVVLFDDYEDPIMVNTKEMTMMAMLEDSPSWNR